MKSLTNDLLRIANGILEDVRLAYPEYGAVGLDQKRLSLLSKTRGLGFFTLDLPSLDALLLQGLKDGRLIPNGPLTTRVSRRIQVPKFLSGLWLRVFDNNSCLRSDVDSTAVAFLRQIFCLGKKIEVACTPQRTLKVVEEYHDIERSMREPTLNWVGDAFDTGHDGPNLHFRDGLAFRDSVLAGGPDQRYVGTAPSTSYRLQYITERLQQFSDDAARLFGFFEPVSFSEDRAREFRGIGFKHGPGAVAERSGNVNKYTFPNWPAKLQEWFPFEFCGKPLYSDIAIPSNHEVPSKLIAVPKTAKGPRLIAAEPTEYMWCQQLMKDFLEDKIAGSLLKDFIDFRDQEKSQHLTRLASLKGDLITVDLSSASDRLSCWTVERMFRRNQSVLHALHSCRTRWTVDRISSPPIFFRKKKFASQGTAVTFPVQTVFFFLCVMACLPGKTLESVARKYKGSVRVFGDDIIMPSSGYADLKLLLTYLGLKVNVEKSFDTGLFRESCGFDGFQGDDVTPIKPKQLGSDGPTSRASLIDTANNLFKKGYWQAAKAVESTAGFERVVRSLPIIGLGSGSLGLNSFVGDKHDHLYKRWNANLQRFEFRSWVFKTKDRREETNGYETLLQYFAEARPDNGSSIQSMVRECHTECERPYTDSRGMEKRLSRLTNPPVYKSGMRLRAKLSDGLGWVPLYGSNCVQSHVNLT